MDHLQLVKYATHPGREEYVVPVECSAIKFFNEGIPVAALAPKSMRAGENCFIVGGAVKN